VLSSARSPTLLYSATGLWFKEPFRWLKELFRTLRTSPGSQPDTLLWDFYITERDASRALEVQMQRRAKLGSVSLRDFLKKFQFDMDGKTMASMVMSAFCETAVASRARVL
jgi:hypothetical protein